MPPAVSWSIKYISNNPGVVVPHRSYVSAQKSRMTKRGKISDAFLSPATTNRGHDHGLGTPAFHTGPHSIGLTSPLTRRNTGTPKAVRIGTTQRQRRVSGRNLKVGHRLVQYIYHSDLLTLFRASHRTQNPIRGMFREESEKHQRTSAEYISVARLGADFMERIFFWREEIFP